MKTINYIIATYFSLIAFGSFCGVIAGATHQVFVCLIASGAAITLFADNKKKASV